MGDSVSNASVAASILRQLALGNDPSTGLPVAAEHLLHRPEVIRALMLAREAIEGKAPSKLPPRAGEPWSETEDKELMLLFEQGESVPSIASSLQRSTGSITSRLAKLDILDDFQVILEDARVERRR